MSQPSAPNDPQAEKSVLGSCLMDREIIAVVAAMLPSPEAFYNESHRLIYAAMLECFQDRIPTDLVTVKAKLADSIDVLQLADLVNAVPTTVHVPFYANIVWEAWQRRRLMQAGNQIMREANSGNGIRETKQRTMQLLAGALTDSPGLSARRDMGEVNRALYDQLGKGPMTSATWGLPSLEPVTLTVGSLTIVAAGTSHGKTTLLETVADHNARMGKTVLFISLEMPAEILAMRRICRATAIPMSRMIAGNLNDTELMLASEAMAKQEEWAGKLHYVDRPLTTAQLQLELHNFILQASGVDLVILDYVQQLQNAERSMRETHTRNAHTLQALALEYDTAILAASQISRSGARADKLELYHIKESGDYENDADNVVLLQAGKDTIGLSGWGSAWPLNFTVGKGRNCGAGWSGQLYNVAGRFLVLDGGEK